MGLFNKKRNNNGTDDCTDLGQVIRDQHDGNRGVELVMGPDGEMMAVPTSEANNMEGVKATQIAKKDYYLD